MFSVCLAIFCVLSLGLALEKDKENGRWEIIEELLQKIILKAYEVNKNTKHSTFLDFARTCW